MISFEASALLPKISQSSEKAVGLMREYKLNLKLMLLSNLKKLTKIYPFVRKSDILIFYHTSGIMSRRLNLQYIKEAEVEIIMLTGMSENLKGMII